MNIYIVGHHFAGRRPRWASQVGYSILNVVRVG